MDIMKMLSGSAGDGGSDSISTIASSLGLDSTQVRAVMARVVPELGAGLQRNATGASGLTSLTRSLQTGDHARYLRDPARLTSASGIDEGNAILGHILGSKDASRSAASAAAASTGVDYGIVKKMLPMVAAAVMGAMSTKSQPANPAEGLDQDGMAGLIGGFLDQDNDGSVADDLLGMAGKLFAADPEPEVQLDN